MRLLKTSALVACLALGCGSALASPRNGETEGTRQNQNQNQNQQPSWNENQPPSAWNEDQPVPQDQQNQQTPQRQSTPQQRYPQPQQPYPQQQAPRNQQGEDQSPRGPDTVVESYEWASGGTHLGVVIEGMTQDLREFFGAPADRGVLVAHVVPNSPAARAGVQVGDVLVDVGHHRIHAADDVISALAEQQGSHIPLDIVRRGRHLRIDAMLAPREQQNQQNQQPQLDNPML